MLIHTPPGDHRRGRSFTLPNGLRVLLLCDPDADQAGAAMSVGAGSSQEPPEFPGLAHLLEHLLFLGTEKYPAPEAFPSFVQGHGGCYNATTEFDQTRYFFEIPGEQLAGALDRFAQFFIAPRLSESAIVQERDVIEAEYRARLADDEQRVLGVIKQVLNPAHPASRFFAGNRETLGAAPEALRRALVAFRERYYTAANLQLVVVGRDSLDTLEERVRRCFAAIPERPLPAPADLPSLVPPGRLPLWLALQPTRPCHELRLCFPVPALQPDDYQQPWDYLGQLLAFCGDGSLQGQLRDRGWLTAIDSAVLLETRPQALFQIRLHLTAVGMAHIGAITAAVFAYLERMAADGIAAWRHRERQLLAEQRFRLAGATSTIECVKSLARQLHRYPVAEALRGPYRLDAFQPQVIADCLACLTPDNLLAVAIDPATRGERESPWFPAAYRIATPPRRTEAGRDEAIDAALPPPNPFISALPATASEISTPSAPVPLHDSGRCRFWYYPFAEGPGARATVYLNLVMARPPTTRNAVVLSELIIAWLEQEVAGELQQARTAGLEVSLARYHQGIALKASGCPAPLERLLPRLVRGLFREPITPRRVSQARQALHAEWHRRRHDYAFRRLLQLPAARLGHGVSDEERLAALATVAMAPLQAFRHEWLPGSGLDGLLAGSLAREPAQRLAAVLEECLPGGDVSPVERHAPVVEPLAAGQAYHYRLATPHADSAVALYLPAPDTTPTQEARYRLLAALLHDAFYRRLRVEEQLGYVVMARYHPLCDRPALILLVQSPSRSVAELEQRIRHFLTAPDAPPLACDVGHFAHYREGLLQALRGQQRRPAQRAEQYGAGLAGGDTAFQRPHQVVQALGDLTLEELQRSYQSQLLSSPWVWLHT